MPTIMLNGNPLEISCEAGLVSDGYHTFDELYEHRCYLFALACELVAYEESPKYIAIDVWKSQKHNDDSIWAGWFIAGMVFKTAGEPDSQNTITYHLPMSMWEEMPTVKTLEKAPEWDGHTPSDVISRIKDFLKK